MKKGVLFVLLFTLLFGVEFTKQERDFLNKHQIIYIAAMKYWPLDKYGNSIHTNYLRLIRKYGKIDIRPVYFKYWSQGYNYAKEGKVHGILSLSYSKEREKYFYYTDAYNFTPYYIIVNKNSGIDSIKDLKGKKVHIAKHSILREAFKNKDFNIVYSKKAFKDLLNGKIDAIMLFYMPKNRYADKFKIIKTYVDKYGEEYLGISKKYPLVYSIIEKIVKQIPQEEIEKIRQRHYFVRKPVKNIIDTDNLNIVDLLTSKDTLFIVLFIAVMALIMFFYVFRIFMKMSIKNFFISVLVIYSVVVGAVIYEIGVYSYLSKKILQIKSKSFNDLYIIDKLNVEIVEWHLRYFKNRKKQKKCSFFDFKIEGKPFKEYLNSTFFNDDEIKYLSNLSLMFNELCRLQKEALSGRTNEVVYQQKLIELIEKLDRLRDIIKTHNDNEIKVIQEKLKFQLMMLITSALLIILLSVFLVAAVRKKIYYPIEDFTSKIKSKADLKEFKYENSDEIGFLLSEIINLTNVLNKNIKELKERKKNLEEQIKNEVNTRLEQEKMLLKQSKLAMMGEMIDSIAHQWKQPLNAISLRVGMLEMDKDEINDEYIKEFVQEIEMQIAHMTETLKEFRNFFRETKNETFCIKRIIDIVLLLLKDELTVNHVNVEKEIDTNFCIEGNENEFKHMIISILTNAKDIFNERGIKNRKVIIKTYEDDKYYYLDIIDNAGGIDEEIIDRIFDMDFTSRDGGSGIGLYLARKIALKHGGIITASNTDNGAKFTFKIEK